MFYLAAQCYMIPGSNGLKSDARSLGGGFLNVFEDRGHWLIVRRPLLIVSVFSGTPLPLGEKRSGC